MMTGRSTLRALLFCLLTSLVGAGLWAIPVASAATPTTADSVTAATSTTAQMCVQANFSAGAGAIFKVPVGAVPATGAALAADDPVPVTEPAPDPATAV